MIRKSCWKRGSRNTRLDAGCSSTKVPFLATIKIIANRLLRNRGERSGAWLGGETTRRKNSLTRHVRNPAGEEIATLATGAVGIPEWHEEVPPCGAPRHSHERTAYQPKSKSRPLSRAEDCRDQQPWRKAEGTSQGITTLLSKPPQTKPFRRETQNLPGSEGPNCSCTSGACRSWHGSP